MRKKRLAKSRIEIIVETERTFMIRSQKATVAFCVDCGQAVDMVTPEAATKLTGISSRAIYQAIEAAKVHFRETPVGLLLVCLNSLIQETTPPTGFLPPPT